MSEPLDLEMVKTRRFWGSAVRLDQVNVAAVLEDFDALLAEVDRLRAEMARRDEQIAAVRALAEGWRRNWAAYGDQITDPTNDGELRVAHRSQKVCADQLLAALDGGAS